MTLVRGITHSSKSTRKKLAVSAVLFIFAFQTLTISIHQSADALPGSVQTSRFTTQTISGNNSCSTVSVVANSTQSTPTIANTSSSIDITNSTSIISNMSSTYSSALTSSSSITVVSSNSTLTTETSAFGSQTNSSISETETNSSVLQTNSTSILLPSPGFSPKSMKSANPAVSYVDFSETGLPQNAEWNVTLNDFSEMSNLSLITFQVPPGFFTYFIASTAGYSAAPSDGFVNTSQTSYDAVNVAFLPDPATLTCWNPNTNSYPFLNYGGVSDPNGWCYGMSSTAVLYFDHYSLGESNYPFFPSQNSRANSTSDLSEPIFFTSVLNNVTLGVMVHQDYDPGEIISLPSYLFHSIDENTQMNSLISYLRQGQPVVLILMSGLFGEGHAVVAWGYGTLANGTYVIAISDPDVPQQPMLAYYDPVSGTFSYNDGYQWNTFGVVDPVPAQYLWAYSGSSNPIVQFIDWLFNHIDFWYQNWITNSVPNYYIVVASQNVIIQSGNLFDGFLQAGNSQSFVSQIPGTPGISEANMEFYAIPVGTPFSVVDGGAASFMVDQINNSTGTPVGYGYVFNATSNPNSTIATTTESNFSSSLTNSTSFASTSISSFTSNTTSQSSGYKVQFSNSTGFAVNSTQPLSLNLGLFTANMTSYSVLNASHIPVATAAGKGGGFFTCCYMHKSADIFQNRVMVK